MNIVITLNRDAVIAKRKCATDRDAVNAAMYAIDNGYQVAVSVDVKPWLIAALGNEIAQAAVVGGMANARRYALMVASLIEEPVTFEDGYEMVVCRAAVTTLSDDARDAVLAALDEMFPVHIA